MCSECLKLTPMKLANIPPPMALREIEVSSTIIDVTIAIRSNDHPRAVVGVLHHHGYSQFEWLVSSMAQNPPICKFMHHFWSTDTDMITNQGRLYLQISFSSNSSLLFSKSVDHSTLTVIGEDGGHTDQVSLPEAGVEGMVRNSGTSNSKTNLVLDLDHQTGSDKLEKRIQGLNDFDTAGVKLSFSPFSTQRVDAVVCDFKIEHAVNGLANETEMPAPKDIIFNLAENGSLFANERRLARNCTSFLVTPTHLIFTTSQHLLKFVHLTGDTEGESSLTRILALYSNKTFTRS